MDVILKKDIENLGFEYEIVSVKPGYGRNYLFPQGLASLATPKARKELAETLEARRAEEESLIADATNKINSIKDLELVLEAKAGAGDKLFGSINNADVADQLSKLGVEVDKKFIRIPGNSIKRLGNYTGKIKLHREVESDFNFSVVAEKEA
ncbi:MAG: 50S ribosomal protein L9 [Weeksellaceae bacterium]|nr:50S ribosomal protein L9 [Weeksellaceae bacterium]